MPPAGSGTAQAGKPSDVASEESDAPDAAKEGIAVIGCDFLVPPNLMRVVVHPSCLHAVRVI
jgi:hypothetical protein